ncbi:Putative aliphatic sulfonates transport permease protein SsuC [Rubripirellula lacrimiformis]|uniref:Aliphatic sulfonates transport permease protein SsuC n=1 Tax=Rubripirellula lacrimiformis TaxID=1930273 RepID=A0A517N816_9BACT|nr:ABC transporter permease subunit [Rubripirellula lacrimiformis]QDT03272.1 Putative aliphatic sulfonates transport permease protein SsuC [Rubripirellula lacrimiformis]
MIPVDRKQRMLEFATSTGLVVSVAIAGIAAWYGVVGWFELPKALLPTPGQVWDAAVIHREELVRGTIATGAAAVAGLAAAIILGVWISIAFSLSRRIRMAFFPYVLLLQTVPIVAVAPLLIIWSGYTFRTVVIVTVIVCLFPIVNSVTTGLVSIDRDASDLFRLYGAGRRRRLTKLQIPSSVQHLMLGAKTSSGLAVIGAIVAEFFVGNGTSYDGLGTLMTGWQGLAKTDALIAALFGSAGLGLALFGAVQLVSSTLLRRWTSSRPTR